MVLADRLVRTAPFLALRGPLEPLDPRACRVTPELQVRPVLRALRGQEASRVIPVCKGLLDPRATRVSKVQPALRACRVRPVQPGPKVRKD